MSISSGIITNAGSGVIPDHISGTSTDYIYYIAIGTGTTTPTVYDTIMEAEVDRAKATIVDTSNRLYLRHEFTLAADTIVSEVGVFDALTGGNMVYHGVAGTCKRTVPAGKTYQASVYLSPESG